MNNLLWFRHLCILLALIILLVMAPPAHTTEQAVPPKTALVAVIPPDFPPTYYRDPSSGKPAGLAVDVMNAVAKHAGLTITYRFAHAWQEIEELLLNDEVDLIPFRVMSEKTTQLFLFSNELDTTAINYIVRDSDQATRAYAPEKKIGVVQGSGAHDYLLKRHPEQTLIVQNSLEHLLIDLLSGQTDIILTPAPNLLRLAENLGLEKRIRVIDPPEYEIKRGIALSRGNEPLRDRLNAAIVTFHHTPEAAMVYEKWLGKPRPYWTIKRIVIAGVGLLIAVSGSLFIWHVTTLRRANRQLKEDQAFLQTLIDAIPDLIFFKNLQSVYLGANQSFKQQLFGVAADQDIAGRTDYDLHASSDTSEAFRRTDREVIKAGKALRYEVAVPLANGTVVHAETVKTPFRDASGNIAGVIGITRDMTEQYAYQQELKEARERAEAANRAKSQFLANMSHELRTPLNGVLGAAQLMNMGPLDAEQRELLEMINTSGENLLAILNDILDLARIEAGTLRFSPTDFSPTALLQETLRFYQPVCDRKKIELDASSDPNLPISVTGDPLRVKQVLFNLMSNAVKFSLQGRISLGCSVVGSGPEQIRLRFTVRDTGIGISPEDQERIFSPFEQVDNSDTREYGGTGLGLAICRRLTELMGGELTLESTLGRGSCFALTLDFLPSHAIDPKPENGSRGTTIASSLLVLVAEDNRINRGVVVELLRRRGHRVLEAENGQSALQLYDQHGGCDLVLLDIQMPVLDGPATLKELRSRDVIRNHHTPVMALTAYAMIGDREKMLEQGFDEYLAKPLRGEDLEAAIKRCCSTPTPDTTVPGQHKENSLT